MHPEACVCCGKEGQFSVLLAVGPRSNDDRPRYFLPNQYAREEIGGPHDVVEAVWFCTAHIRAVEDNVRATIRYFQDEQDEID